MECIDNLNNNGSSKVGPAKDPKPSRERATSGPA